MLALFKMLQDCDIRKHSRLLTEAHHTSDIQVTSVPFGVSIVCVPTTKTSMALLWMLLTWGSVVQNYQADSW